MKTLAEVVEVIKELPEELQCEVRDFARFIRDTHVPRPAVKMKLDWRGALRDEFTSVELQHAILEWRKKHACS